MKKIYDAIIVGAGPAGITAAIELARKGLEVVVVERGEYPGSKNMFGGVFFSGVLEQLVPKFWEEAPVERYITRKVISFLTEDSVFSIDYKNTKLRQSPFNGFTILRPKFDKWYASKAEDAGALIVTDTVVDNVIKENGRVVGVETRRDEGKLYANVVIVADGVNSILAKKAGMRKDFSSHSISLGVKEDIKLSRKVIEDRFGLSGNEGLANEFVGAGTQGLNGGAFFYTNLDSVSLGVIVQIDSLVEKKIKPTDILDSFKKHPIIKDMIRDGVTREYSAHLIPEDGLMMNHKLYADGVLLAGDAAGFVLVNGYNFEGVNYAVASGLAAATAVVRAAEKNDFSSASLANYETELKKGFVLQDLNTFKKAHSFMQNKNLYNVYPEIACSLADKLFVSRPEPKEKILNNIRSTVKEKMSYRELIKDLFQGGRAL